MVTQRVSMRAGSPCSGVCAAYKDGLDGLTMALHDRLMYTYPKVAGGVP